MQQHRDMDYGQKGFIFNSSVQAYPPKLMERLASFIERNSRDWILRLIGENMVELRVRDLRTKEAEIDTEVTRTILGEGDELLTPNVGYPPSERWWD